jgi:Cu(I)/Ag(I) efflux system membrane fusion protein
MTTKMKIAAAALAAVLLLGGGWTAYRHFAGHQHGQDQKAVYYCPMHPDYTADRPGDCPICGMHLVKREPAAAAPAGERKVKFYRNPMDPSVTSKVPMKDGMGMDYVPVYEDGAAAAAVAGRGPVSISPEKQQLIGLRTGKAAWRAIPITVRAAGTVAYDPDLYRAITEYKEALAAYGRIKEGGWPEAMERAKAVVDSSKMKLRQLGFGDEHLTGAEEDPKRYGNLLLPEDEVWVYAQVYEYESAAVKPGQKAVITSSAYPGKEFPGVVRSLDPIFSAETRTLRARIETQNPGRELRLEMYVEAAIKAAPVSVLTVPAGAILNTGEKELVFVMKGEGTFEPREIKSGRRNDDYTEVLSGLRAGETVVTSANFIVDSESRMKAAIGD